MLIGDPHTWAIRFRSVDQRLIERIVEIWQKCLDVLSEQPDEDMITRNLIYLLCQDSEVRRIGYLEYQYVPFSMISGGGVSEKGFVDIAVVLDQERDCYIAYECKRLNVKNKRKRESLATPYVKKGMMRYVTEQYSEGLPFACMLGYVIDGDIPFARKAVWKAINTGKLGLRLLDGPTSTDKVATFERFITIHERQGGTSKIEMSHALLPFKVASY
jgi:hypothetical protein